MAAGMGNRMQPLTKMIPKPLVKVKGTPFIETMIQALNRQEIAEIYVIVGYKKEQFQYLMEKYPGVTLIVNEEYEKKNNLTTLYKARHILKKNDCFICEADILVSNPEVFGAKLSKSCYYGKMVEGETDDWAFVTEGNRIVQIGKGGKDLYNMVGISYFKKEDGQVLAEKIEELYGQNGTEQLFWDEAANMILEEVEVVIHPVGEAELIEIDTIKELVKVDENYQYLLSV